MNDSEETLKMLPVLISRRGVTLRLVLDVGTYVVMGKIGRVYRFLHGETVEVDSRDAPGLLSKTRRAGCCGSPTREQPIFEEVLK